MVFFTCDACGESMKKNAVDKHYRFQCRNCSVLSCVDCGKAFPGDAYMGHTKCISEEEKYSGKGFKPKPNANKGEVKQNSWLEQVHAAISKCSNTDFKLKSLLERLIDYPNIPRKKAKFENFIKNSMAVRDPSLTARTWDVIAAEMNKPNPETVQNSNNAIMNGKENRTQPEKNTRTTEAEEESGEDSGMSEKKLSKREKKEERRKQQHKEEKKSKKLKRKHAEEEEQEEPASPLPKKKKDKRKHKESENVEEEVVQLLKKRKNKADKHVEEEPAAEDEAYPAVKFTWEDAIIGVLRREDDHELSIKRLRKKVLAQYLTHGAETKMKTEEELFAKFNKKIKKNPCLRVLKDRVKLLQL